MASLRRQSSPLVSPHLASLSPRDPSGLSLPPAASSSLTLPASLHRNRSFARLAKVFGLSSSAVVDDDAGCPTAAQDHPVGSARASSASRPDRKNDGSDEDEEDDEDDEDADRNDEENILWEAQVSIAPHHPFSLPCPLGPNRCHASPCAHTPGSLLCRAEWRKIRRSCAGTTEAWERGVCCKQARRLPSLGLRRVPTAYRLSHFTMPPY